MNKNIKTDFRVGTEGGDANFFDGLMSGLAVYSAALSKQDIMQMHLATRSPEDPLFVFDYQGAETYHDPTTGLAPHMFGWQVSGTGYRVTTDAKFRLCVKTNQSDASSILVFFGAISDVPISHTSRAEFSVTPHDNFDVRFCARVDGQWLATPHTLQGGTQKVQLGDDVRRWSLIHEDSSHLRIGSVASSETANLQHATLTGVGFLMTQHEVSGLEVCVGKLNIF